MAIENAVNATQTGFQSLTSSGVWNGRTITAGTGISITNGDGISGNPTISTSGSSGGQLVLIQTQTASSSATLTFSTGTNVYTNHFFVVSNLQGATNNTHLCLQCSLDGGSTWITTGYASGVNYTAYNSTTWTNTNTTAQHYCAVNIANTNANQTLNGEYYLFNCNQPVKSYMTGQFTYVDWNGGSSIVKSGYAIGQTGNTGANAFKFFMSSGNISKGTISLFGIKPN